jgi:hypothetical protein
MKQLLHSLHFDVNSLCYSYIVYPVFKCPESVAKNLRRDSFKRMDYTFFQISQTRGSRAVQLILRIHSKEEIRRR